MVAVVKVTTTNYLVVHSRCKYLQPVAVLAKKKGSVHEGGTVIGTVKNTHKMS